MKGNTILMKDYPDTERVRASLVYALFGFLVIPILMMHFTLRFEPDLQTIVGLELGYHALNFIVAIIIFFPYLLESFENVQLDYKRFFKVTAIGTLALLALTVVLVYIGFAFHNSLLAAGVLPLTEQDWYSISGHIVMIVPFVSTIVMVLLEPFVVSLLIYATAFGTIRNKRPWLGYLLTALMLLVPRMAFGVSYWHWQEELIVYLVRLPLHMICCRIYQKTDTVWAPIVALMVVNLFSCALMLILR